MKRTVSSQSPAMLLWQLASDRGAPSPGLLSVRESPRATIKWAVTTSTGPHSHAGEQLGVRLGGLAGARHRYPPSQRPFGCMARRLRMCSNYDRFRRPLPQAWDFVYVLWACRRLADRGRVAGTLMDLQAPLCSPGTIITHAPSGALVAAPSMHHSQHQQQARAPPRHLRSAAQGPVLHIHACHAPMPCAYS